MSLDGNPFTRQSEKKTKPAYGFQISQFCCLFSSDISWQWRGWSRCISLCYILLGLRADLLRWQPVCQSIRYVTPKMTGGETERACVFWRCLKQTSSKHTRTRARENTLTYTQTYTQTITDTIQYNITLFPSVNTLIARGMFCGARYTHHTFTPIIKH